MSSLCCRGTGGGGVSVAWRASMVSQSLSMLDREESESEDDGSGVSRLNLKRRWGGMDDMTWKLRGDC